MKEGRASRTAELVCMGRALADVHPSLAGLFTDPTAFALLPDEARARVERIRSGAAPKGLRRKIERGYLLRQSKVMIARSVAIDEAVREAAASQLVILGAGLDGRAWRMKELADVVVFEVDHPDSQRDKRARVSALRQTAREVRFAPVDFTRDSLDEALAGAGHDPERKTTWIWEGVVMYLERRAIDATLDVVAKRSAPRSGIIILYHSPAPILRIVGTVVGLLGEPLRSSFRPEAMRALLEAHGFDVVRDEGVPEIGKALSPALGEATKVTKHLRIVTAARP